MGLTTGPVVTGDGGPRIPEWMRGHAKALLCSLAWAATTATACTADTGDDFDFSRHSIPTDEILSGGPPKDGIPALLEPRFQSAAEVGWLRGDDRVAGIAPSAAGAPAKAYPLRILTWHEIVNDEVGSQAVAVTYCPLTDSVRVFDRRSAAGATLTFGVSGRLYDSNLLMYDHQTESLWSQLGGEAVTGGRTGTGLVEIPGVVTTWGKWRDAHPDTLVLARPTEHERDYQRDPYRDYAASGSLMFRPGRRSARYPDKEHVVGVVIDGVARAYPFSELAKRGGLTVEEEFRGHRMRVDFDGTDAVVHVDDELRTGARVYWFAWYTFHPETTVWTHLPSLSEAAGRERIADVEVESVKSYWTSFMGGGGFMLEPGTDGFEKRGGLFVVTGSLRNASDASIDHVVLLYELVNAEGQVVYREEGVNRAAEQLLRLAEGVGAAKAGIDIAPIAPGDADSYRMIFIGDEVPDFDRPRVSILAVE